MLFTRCVYTLISDSASVISTLLNQGRLFWSLLPHVIIQDHLLLFSVVIYSWRVPMSAICIEYVVCETITLLSFALYLYVRSHVRIFIHMSTRVPREQWQLLVLRSHSSSLPVSRSVIGLMSPSVLSHIPAVVVQQEHFAKPERSGLTTLQRRWLGIL